MHECASETNLMLKRRTLLLVAGSSFFHPLVWIFDSFFWRGISIYNVCYCVHNGFQSIIAMQYGNTIERATRKCVRLNQTTALCKVNLNSLRTMEPRNVIHEKNRPHPSLLSSSDLNGAENKWICEFIYGFLFSVVVSWEVLEQSLWINMVSFWKRRNFDWGFSLAGKRKHQQSKHKRKCTTAYNWCGIGEITLDPSQHSTPFLMNQYRSGSVSYQK